MIAEWDEATLEQALCRRHDGGLWFSSNPAELAFAKTVCGRCVLREPCLAGALERREPWGVWGGEVFERGVIRSLPTWLSPAVPDGPAEEVVAIKAPDGQVPSASALTLAGTFARLLPPTGRDRYTEEYRAEIWDLCRAGKSRWSQLGHVFRLGARTAELYVALLKRRTARS